MINFSRAMKLYIRAALNPVSIIFAIFFAAIMMIAFVIDPAPIGNEDHMSMIGALQMGHIGGCWIIMLGNSKLQQNKFFSASSIAKILYTAVPIITALFMGLVYDIIINVIAVFNSAGVSDILVFNAISTVCLVIMAACFGKKKLTWGYVVPYLFFLFTPTIFNRAGIANGTLGLTIGSAAVIAVGIYAAVTVLALVAVNIWWKNSDRFDVPNKYVQNAMSIHS